eukprot:1716942-Amphidinium_carterae.1
MAGRRRLGLSHLIKRWKHNHPELRNHAHGYGKLVSAASAVQPLQARLPAAEGSMLSCSVMSEKCGNEIIQLRLPLGDSLNHL